MKTHYDSDADAMYITLNEDEVDTTKKIDDNTLLDLNKKGEIVGIEVLFVRERNPEILKTFKIDKLLTA